MKTNRNLFLSLCAALAPALLASPPPSVAAESAADGVSQGIADLAPAISSQLQEQAKSLGLDANSPTLAADIQDFIETKAIPQAREAMKDELQKMGLGPDATWQEIIAKGEQRFQQTGQNQLLEAAAKKLGMDPGTATWSDVMTGFSDQSHFTRRFKRVVGVPPGQYAKCYAPRARPGGVSPRAIHAGAPPVRVGLSG